VADRAAVPSPVCGVEAGRRHVNFATVR
jgi:hypothetical protein